MLKIGEVAAQTGVSVEAIRYYERLGLLRRAPRSPSGYRQFGEDAIRRLGFIRRAQALGFALAEIKDLLELRGAPDAEASQIRERARVKLADVGERIRDLERMREALERVMSSCRGQGPLDECPILDALERDLDLDEAPASSAPAP